MRQIITTRAGNPFGRMDPVSLYRRADPSVGMDFSRWICCAAQHIFDLLKSIPEEISPRKQIRWRVHTIGSIRRNPFAGIYLRMDSIVCMGPYMKSKEARESTKKYTYRVWFHRFGI